MKKILIVFGTRPEAIKMAPLVKEFQKFSEYFDLKVCVTAQHREMLDQVLELFQIVPDFDLNIMKSKQDLYDVTSNILLGMRPVLSDFKPDFVFVHGDTSTTFAAALASFYQQICIAHIEAGLRTGSIYSPWPEEANRQLTTRICNYHFAPTLTSKKNLVRENVDESSIFVTGNTVIDALFLGLNKIKNNQHLEEEIISRINGCLPTTFQLPIIVEKLNQKIILVTGHRRENHGLGFVNICKALKQLAENNPKVNIIYPVHLNPNVKQPVQEYLNGIANIHLIKPLQYEQFIYLMDKSSFIITDSGGIQEEAPALGKPVLVLRDTTERPEAIEAGTVKLVGTDVDEIISSAQSLLDDDVIYQQMSQSHNPYGDGKSSKRIVKYLINNILK